MNQESEIVKNMGYNSYYIKKISSMKDFKKRRKYLFKLVSNYSKFHNIQCNIKSQYCKNIQSGGSPPDGNITDLKKKKSSKDLLDILDKYIKNLEQREFKLSKLNKIKIKTLHSENIIFEKNNKTLESENTKFKNELQSMKLKLIDLEGKFKIKDNLSITRIKTLENIFIDFTIKQIIYLKTIFLDIYPEYNVYNDLNTLLTLMRTSSNFNATSIADAKRNNERLDYLYPDNYNYLQDSIYSVNLAICDLFEKTGILLSSNIIPIITTKDKNLGWIDNDDNDKIVYYESGSFVNKDTKIAYTKISTKEIDIKNFDDISKHIIDFDESNDKLARIDLQKILIIIDEGLNILMNSCSCETMCTYQYEGKVAHWCKLPSKPTCARGAQGYTAYSKNCNPLKNGSKHVYMTEKSNKSKTKQYYIGSHPFASNANEIKNNKYCIYDTSNKKVILSNKKKCAFVKVTVQQLLEKRNNDVHGKNRVELSKNIDNAVRTITTKKID
jgi:hypothetical protein